MNYVFLLLLVAAIGLIECLIGGTRLLFSLPSYSILALASILSIVSSLRIRAVPNLWCLLSTAVFFAFILFRAAHSPVDYLARPDFYMVLGCLMVYLLTAFYITNSRLRILFIFFLLALAVVNVWVGIVQFAQGNEYMLFGFIRPKCGCRASGLYISPNHYACFLETVALFALSLAWWSRLKVWLKLFLCYLGFCCYAGLAISQSRGGYCSSLVSLMVFAILSLRVIQLLAPQKLVRIALMFVLVGGAIVGIAIFLMLGSLPLRERMQRMTDSDIRFYNWPATLDQFRLQPVFGTGAGTNVYYSRLFRRPRIQSDPIHAHCDYLELLAEYGVVGGAGMAFFIWIHLANGLRTYSWLLRKRLRHSSDARSDTLALNIGALSAIVALAVHSVVDFNMHIPGNALMFAFIFGLMANPGIDKQDQEGLAPSLAGMFRFTLPVLGLWLLISGVPKLPAEYFAEQARVALRDKDYPKVLSEANKAMGGEIPPGEAGWPERVVRTFGGDKLNPNLYFYCGEANRVIGLASRNIAFNNYMLERMRLGAAVDFYQHGVLVFPQDENMLVRLGQTLDGLKRYGEAEDVFQEAIRLDPNLAVIYGYYGAHLKAMGRIEESKAAYEKGQKLAAYSIGDVQMDVLAH